MASTFEWNINLQPLVGKTVIIETFEGHIRESKLTAARFRDIEINGTMVGYPVEVELNGEDVIPFIQIRKFNLKK